ncbi:hypothetical protein ACSNOI_36105 [Actinomadura kijaniata]
MPPRHAALTVVARDLASLLLLTLEPEDFHGTERIGRDHHRRRP